MALSVDKSLPEPSYASYGIIQNDPVNGVVIRFICCNLSSLVTVSPAQLHMRLGTVCIQCHLCAEITSVHLPPPVLMLNDYGIVICDTSTAEIARLSVDPVM
jgi:Na+-translocating ferredoxin:NAD+ oxidoreductase RnfC subunit